MKSSITFLGDISLNDDYYSIALKGKNPFSAVQNILKEEDFIIGNLEAVCFGNEGQNKNKITRLGVHPYSLNLLNYLNLNVVTLANNHIYDQLFSGFTNTLDFLSTNNIDSIGARLCEKPEINKVYHINGKDIRFLNYVHPRTNPLIPEDSRVCVNIYNKDKIIESIIECKRKDQIPILLLHWGLDNSKFPEPWQRKDARAFVGAGAEIIVGHHSHVLQGHEIIKGKHVYYSLGNFAFSRHLNNGRYYDIAKRQKDSIVLKADFQKEKINFDVYPIILDKLHVYPKKRNSFNLRSKLIPFISNPLVWKAYSFYLNIVFKFGYFLFGNGRNPIRQVLSIDKRKLKRLLQILKITK